MVKGNEQIVLSRRRLDSRIIAGVCATAAVAALVGGAFAGLAASALGDLSGAYDAFDLYLFRVARFSLLQAGLSTLLAIAPAIFVARAIAQYPSFPGRSALLQLFAVPLALPAIVVALGVLALYGRAGLITALPGFDDPRSWSGIYGMRGILIAHVFFNMPLAVRLLLHALATVPGDHWRLSAQLGMSGWTVFRLIEWPAFRAALPGVAGLVFMLCITSFAIVLILGGGPRATTLEVAIYQSLRFDFDPARAIALTSVQIALTTASVMLLSRIGTPAHNHIHSIDQGHRYNRPGHADATLGVLLVGSATIFVAAPMAATVISGFHADFARLLGEPAVWRATATSLAFAAASAVLCTALSMGFVSARWSASRSGRPALSRTAWIFDAGASLVLVVPPIVIGAGWFILAGTAARISLLAPLLVIAVNAVMAMPFAIRALRPAHDTSASRHDRLCAQLAITGLNRFRLIDWPVMRQVLATAFVFAMALSLGDLGVIALFGSDSVQTLPYLILSRMGSYRTADAAGLALVLGAVCFLMMTLSGWIGQRESR